MDTRMKGPGSTLSKTPSGGGSPEPLSEEARIETLKIRRLRTLVDLASSLLRQTDMPLTEAVRLVQAVRKQALDLFPGKERTFDLIYAPRFARILREKYGIESEAG
jgi:hypothetical protein